MGVIRLKLDVYGGKASKMLDVLIDSGASQSVIDRALAEQICIMIPLRDPLEIKIPHQGIIIVNQVCTFSTEIDGYKISDTALVIDHLGEVDLVIGAKTMQRYGMHLEFSEEKDTVRVTKPQEPILFF
jgi:predicted aspartyl protease